MTPSGPDTPPEPVSPDAAALPAGHTVFEYRIEKTLGGGGFGITYLARDVNLQLPVALKEYFPGELSARAADLSVQVRTPEAAQPFKWGLERFLDEARALAAFRHPNIVRVLRYFRENGSAYIVMEYESGDPLKRWLARWPRLDQAGLLKVIYPLLDGLEAVHKLDFLHRDIKPDNIHVRADGTPVLLDFGAARRPGTGRELTNIVSPGFAPFEQYHSQGRQGPWSDLYSLGAVMYWMTTGHKPAEAASRVQGDNMPRAVELADPALFSDSLLRAIDWALSPEIAQRPQQVAELRAALMQAGAAPQGLGPRPGAWADSRPGPLSVPAMSGTASTGAGVPPRRNMLSTVMFTHLVASSKTLPDQLTALQERFDELVSKALRGVAEDTRWVLSGSEGTTICFLGDPEDALQSALLLRSLLQQKYGAMLGLRAGLHLGPVRVLQDGAERIQLVGDGVNVAQRIMDFASPNEIVASRAYHDVITRITDHAAGLFSAKGPHLDKHLRSHEIYALLEPLAGSVPEAAARDTAFENTASFAALATLTPDTVAEIEAELARSIGPLAKVLVHKARTRSISAQGLRELLAVSIPDPSARELFIKPKSHKTQPVPNTSMRGEVSRSLNPFSRSRREPSQPLSGPGAAWAASSPHFSADQLVQLERALSQFIGPLAKMIVQREAPRHTALQTLVAALAAEVDKPADRASFLAAAPTA